MIMSYQSGYTHFILGSLPGFRMPRGNSDKYHVYCSDELLSCKCDDSVLGVLFIVYRLVGHIFCTTNCFITLTLLAFATLSLNQSDLKSTSICSRNFVYHASTHILLVYMCAGFSN